MSGSGTVMGKEYFSKYRNKNRKKINEQHKKWYRGYWEKNKNRINKVARELRMKNPQNVLNAKASRYVKIYGITIEEYERLLKEQNGLCKICKQPESQIMRGKQKSLAVDHNHETGEIRGLLCGKCNSGIGMFRENTLLLSEAIKYLNSF